MTTKIISLDRCNDSGFAFANLWTLCSYALGDNSRVVVAKHGPVSVVIRGKSSASGAARHGIDPGPRHPKDVNMVPA